MRQIKIMVAFVAAIVSTACAAERFEDPQLKVEVEAPEGFSRSEGTPPADPFVGEFKAAFASPEVGTTAGALLIHHMPLPNGIDYPTFKGTLATRLGTMFGDRFRLLRQQDVEVGKIQGFVLEFQCPGDGRKPEVNGSIPHQIRWYLFQGSDGKLIGLIYSARQESWKDLDTKFAASFKTLKLD
jgi:hypothetical protein